MSEHIVPVKVYIVIFLVLLVGTALTVLAAFQDFTYHVGSVTLALNTPIALLIAVTKATFVVLYFMHVKYASRMTKLVVVTGLFFLGILLSETMIDYASRMWVNPPALLQ